MRTGYMNFHKALITALLLTVSGYASAETGYSIGLEIGGATIDASAADFNDGSLGATARMDGDIAAWGVYGEMEFNRYLRAELGLIDGAFGTMDAVSNGSSYFWWPGAVEAEYGLGGIKAGAVAMLPLGANDRFRLLGKLGLVTWASVVNLKDSWGTVTDTDAGVTTYVGVGAEFDVTDRIAIRAQHEMFSVSADSEYLIGGYDFDYSKVTAGIRYSF